MAGVWLEVSGNGSAVMLRRGATKHLAVDRGLNHSFARLVTTRPDPSLRFRVTAMPTTSNRSLENPDPIGKLGAGSSSLSQKSLLPSAGEGLDEGAVGHRRTIEIRRRFRSGGRGTLTCATGQMGNT